MAGVLRRLFGPQKEIVLDPKILELQAAKEILAEVFRIRISKVDEMIQSRFEDASHENIGAKEDGLWSQEFRLAE